MCRRYKLLYLLSLFILCCAAPAIAQHDIADSAWNSDADTAAYNEDVEEAAAPERVIVYNTARPAAAQWQQATSSEAYSYRDKREYIKKGEPPREEVPGWIRFIEKFFRFLASSTGKLMLWIAFALIVGYIAYRVIAGRGGLFGQRDRKQSGPAEDTDNVSEQGLLENDWEARLHAALGAGDQRLAIRYSYMHLLQAMQERGLIAYRPDKTNTGYYRELTESMKQPFRAVSRQYEYAWYGNFLPDPAAMESYMQTYSGLKKSITYA